MQIVDTKVYVDVSKYASTYFLGTDYTDFTDNFDVYIH